MSKIISKLPVIIQTEPQKKFFDSTFEQLFQKKSAISEIGFIGQKPGRRYNPNKDYYLEQYSNERRNYQLEPVSYTLDPKSLEERNVVFYTDLLNYLDKHKGLTANHERLFRTSRYSYAPPIDVDKFINYQNYFWILDSLPAIEVPFTRTQLELYFIDNPNLTEIEITSGDKTINLSTGMTVKVTDVNEPLEFQRKGNTVELVQIDDIVLPYNQYRFLEWDEYFEPWDELPWEVEVVGLPFDYITIERGSVDKNGWSRTNRWYHKDVVFQVAQFLGIDLPQYKIAVRPIIEFTKHLELFDSGTQFLQYVEYTTETITYNDIVNSAVNSIIVDSGILRAGHSILIRNGENSGVYRASTAPNGNYSLTAVPHTDGDIIITRFGIIPEEGGNRGKTYFWNGTEWQEAVTQKYGINQPPLFMLYDTDGVGLNDFSKYPNASFAGNKIFSYKENEFSPVIDRELGFALTYEGLGQISDIVFENSIFTDRETWSELPGSEKINIDGYYYANNLVTGVKINSWLANKNSTPNLSLTSETFFNKNQQSVIDQYTVLANGNNRFTISLANPESVRVFYNGIRLEDNEFAVDQNAVVINRPTRVDDNVAIYSYSSRRGLENRNQFGYYEIPEALRSNPLNDEITQASQNSLSNHFVSIIENQDGIKGNGLGLTNNYRDTNRDLSLGDYILQTNSPLPLTMLATSSNELDLIEALRFSKNKYTQYKNKFIKTAAELSMQNYRATPSNDTVEISKLFNEVITRMMETNEFVDAFRSTHMFAYTGYVDYPISSVVANDEVTLPILDDVSDVNTHLYVYSSSGNFESDRMLIVNHDYLVVSDSPLLLKFNSAFSNVIVRIYPNSAPCYMPSTPSKMGMYSVYKPQRVIDKTYVDPMEVIIGHDGSRTPVTGNSLVDALILELESRIYNSIDREFSDPDYSPVLKRESVFPGKYRVTDYEYPELVSVYQQNLAKWANIVQANVTSNTSFDANNWMTYNTTEGSWKRIFLDIFDTLTPFETPWEMFGFGQKPAWWDEVYLNSTGRYNYNAIFGDAQTGTIRRGPRQGVDPRYARPGIRDESFVNPVLGWVAVNPGKSLVEYFNETFLFDNLPGPLRVPVVSESFFNQAASDWEYGDIGPAENAWMKTELYPFELMELLFITKPAEFGFSFWDTKQREVAVANSNQWINRSTFVRSNYTNVDVHREFNEHGEVYKSGWQHWVSDRLSYLNRSITDDFGSLVRRLGVKLGHKLAGFTNPETLELYLESTSSSSTGNSLLIPNENINVAIHSAPPVASFVYSGVVVTKIGNQYAVSGYDMLDLSFTIYPRNRAGAARQITVGGTPVAFRLFNTASSYKVNEIVKYNGTYYQALVNISPGIFNRDEWNKLAELPTAKGVTVTYIKEFEPTPVIVNYNTVYNSLQEVFDFLIGYGDYLESQGWVFNEVDPVNNQINNWLTSAKDFLFWADTNWADYASIRLSPAGSKLILDVVQGYPAAITSTVNGVYNLLDQDAAPMQNSDVNVMRDGTRIEVMPRVTTQAVYLARVYAMESEHRITFDNTTSFGDVVNNLVLGVRQSRLVFNGLRSQNWFGKKEAPGYVITKDNKLVPNFDTLVESIRRFHDTETRIDRQQIEDVARRLIGFETKSYLNDLNIRQDNQYQFYQGMIKQKGTVETISKILRSSSVTTNKSIQSYEEFAFRLSDFGGSDLLSRLDLAIDSFKVKSDPQIVSLVTENTVTTATVKSIIVVTSEYTYTSTPVITVAPPTGVGTTATARAILTPQGKLSSIEVVDPGSKYTQEPLITISTSDGLITNDRAVAILEYEITPDDALDDVITIDVDNPLEWLTKPQRGSTDDSLWLTEYRSPRMPSAGFILPEEWDISVFNESALVGRFLVLDQYVHMSCDYTGSWAISKVVNNGETVTVDAATNTFTVPLMRSVLSQNLIVVGGTVYTTRGGEIYDPLGVKIERIADLTSVLDFAGYTVRGASLYDVNGIEVVLSNLADFNVYTLASRKYPTLSTTVIDSTLAVNDRMYIVDNGADRWAVYEYGNPAPVRVQTPVPVSSLFSSVFMYEDVSKDTLALLNVYDPLFDGLPGVADQNIDIKLGTDPAKYNRSLDSSLINETLKFGPDQVGTTWLDLSSFAYIDYSQGSNTYRRNIWGKLSPGSDPAVYEWVKSYNPPSEYNGEGVPRNTTDYTEISVFDPNAGYSVSFYFFWVRGKTSFPRNKKSRTMSTSAVEQLLRSPSSQGYRWFAALDSSNFMFANVGDIIENNKCIIQINYKKVDRDFNRHTEWYLMSEGRPASVVKDAHWQKLTDSLCSSTRDMTEFELPRIAKLSGSVVANGGSVSTVMLTDYGSGYIDPPHVTFSSPEDPNGITATAEAVLSNDNVTEIVITNPGLGYTSAPTVTIELPPGGATAATARASLSYYLMVPDPSLAQSEKYGIKHRPRQSMFVDVLQARKVFVQAVNELLDDINFNSIGIDYTQYLTTNNYWRPTTWIADGYTVQDLVPKYLVSDLSAISSLNASDGDVVKVDNGEIVFYTLVGGPTIAVEHARLQINEALYQDFRSGTLRDELRQIIGLLDVVFTNEYRVRKNILWFAMVNYILSEQQDIDWVFKTTYLSFRQDGVELTQSPVLVNDPFDSFIDYVNEVKPYSTKVRDYRNSFTSFENVNVSVNEYDKKSIRIKFDRVVPNSVNEIKTIDAATFLTGGWDFIPWASTQSIGNPDDPTMYSEQNSLPWDNETDSVQYFQGAHFVYDSIVASRTGADVVGAELTLPAEIESTEFLIVKVNNVVTHNYTIDQNTIIFNDGFIPQLSDTIDFVVRPPVAASVSGSDMTFVTIANNKPRSSVAVPPVIYNVANMAIYVNDVQTLNYYIYNGFVYFPYQFDSTDRIDFYQIQPADAQSFTLPEETVGSAQEIVPIAPHDGLVITVTENPNSATEIRFRISRTMEGETLAERATKTAVLLQPLGLLDNTAYLDNVNNLPLPSRTVPGTVWIGNERINYTSVNSSTNTITGLVRGTRGTAVVEKTAGTVVTLGADSEQIPQGTSVLTTEYSDIGATSIWASNTRQARFLRGES